MPDGQAGPGENLPPTTPVIRETCDRGSRQVQVFSFDSTEIARGQDVVTVGTQLLPDLVPLCILDLAGINRIEGAFFGELLKLMKLVKAAGGTLKLCQLAPPLRDVLRVTRMERLFEVFEDRPAALASFDS